MDCNMPVMDGFEATQRILKMSPTAKIIALTAY
jgi:CheY-like chemotaxis protein